MYGTFIEFSYPWLLLLLLPAFAATLIPYFLSNKKYRRNRNRICSIVLHSVAITLAVLALSGMKFVSRVANDTNEIIILVDMSDSEDLSSDRRDDFVETVINQAKFDGFNIGVVTFGYDQVYAVPMTEKTADVFGGYKTAKLPDTAATDIAAAINYAKDLFTDPENGKIVLVTDGKETDGNASSVIRTVSARGIKIDVAHIPAPEEISDVQITGITLPDTHININERYKIAVTLTASDEFSAEVTFFDNAESAEDEKVYVDLVKGDNVIYIEHMFTSQGLHELYCTLSAGDGDRIVQNNEYYTYHYLKLYNKILILETTDGDSEALAAILSDEQKFEVETINILGDGVPTAIDELRRYDQIILNNVGYSDLAVHDDLEYNLQVYVRDYGGGLFTVGGDDDGGEARAYNYTDMLYSTYYKQMLPIEAIKYTPPVAVMILIDRSGSMGQDVEGTNFWYAKAGAASCVNALTERDYIGVMTFDDTFHMVLPLTSRTQESKIMSSINKITATGGGGTVFPGAIQRAGMALRELKTVEKRHIIMVTDGGVPEEERPDYERLIKEFYDINGITFSTVLIGEPETSEAGQRMKYASVELGHGRLYAVPNGEQKTLARLMREDLNVPEIKEMDEQAFYPVISDPLSKVAAGMETENKEGAKNSLTVELGGFYGVKARSAATTVMTGPYGVPLYSYWKYGSGFVGSFMCDLSGKWSADFMESDTGVKFIENVLYSIMPLESIRTEDFELRLTEENYTNHLSIFTPLGEGEKYGGTIEYIESGESFSLTETVAEGADKSALPVYITTALSEENAYNRVNFVVKKGGVYKITVNRCNAGGSVVGTVELYKDFAYSKEYDAYLEQSVEDTAAYMKTLAASGNGAFIADLEDPKEIFDTFTLTLDKVFDPRVLFMILIIVLFLLDVIVRKFKFKWPHELVREYKKKKAEKKR